MLELRDTPTIVETAVIHDDLREFHSLSLLKVRQFNQWSLFAFFFCLCRDLRYYPTAVIDLERLSLNWNQIKEVTSEYKPYTDSVFN